MRRGAWLVRRCHWSRIPRDHPRAVGESYTGQKSILIDRHLRVMDAHCGRFCLLGTFRW